MDWSDSAPPETGVYTVLGWRGGELKKFKRIYRKETGWVLADFELLEYWRM